MNQKQLRADFRKECREEKRKSYQFTMIGMITTFSGLLLALIILLLDQFTTIFLYPWPIILYAIGTIVAIAGMVLEGIGEYRFNQEFKTYTLKMKQEKVKAVVKEEEKPPVVQMATKVVKENPVKVSSKEKLHQEKVNRPKPSTQTKKQVPTQEKKGVTKKKVTPKKSVPSKGQSKVSSTKKVGTKTKGAK